MTSAGPAAVLSSISTKLRNLFQRPTEIPPSPVVPQEAEREPSYSGAAESVMSELRTRIEIATCSYSVESAERDELITTGQTLARRDDWERLSGEMRLFDAGQNVTGGGRSKVDLLVAGANYDVLRILRVKGARAPSGDALTTAEHALRELKFSLEDHPDGWPTALVQARAHLALAMSYRLARKHGTRKSGTKARIEMHLDHATGLLYRFDPRFETSAFTALGLDLALAGRSDILENIDLSARQLAALAHYPHALRALGMCLIRFRDSAQLEAHARALLNAGDSRTADSYAWIYSEALARNDQAFEHLSIERFLKGVKVSLEQDEAQHQANFWAAFLAVALSEPDGLTTHARRSEGRDRLHEAARWVMRDHLRELSPRKWVRIFETSSLKGEDEDYPEALGRDQALWAIAHCFRDEFSRYDHLKVQPDGWHFTR